MAKRKIIKIDEDKCNGCGLCVPNCPEGALQIIEGKARLVGDLLCDGLGACIGECPQNAILIEEREAVEYDENKVMENIIKGPEAVIAAHLKHLDEHNQEEYLKQALEFLRKNKIVIPKYKDDKINLPSGCPGTRIMDFAKNKTKSNPQSTNLDSELAQWPIQLHLLNPSATYFKDADLLIAADCVPFSFANFHQRFLKDKKLIIFCPKLDRSNQVYVDKLAQIFELNNIKSITIAHMQVPCCFGTISTVEEALKQSGKNIIIKEYNISLDGKIL